MRVRVRNAGTFEEQWRDLGAHGNGYVHRWDRMRRDIDAQLAAQAPVRRPTSLPLVTVALERAA